jgi:hypothetical protein
MSLIPELEREVEAAVRRRIAAAAEVPVRRRRRGRARASRRLILVVVGALLLAATVALAAGGVIQIGPPLEDAHPIPQRPDVGLGTAEPGTTKLLAVRAPDPAGGPPWGLRMTSTTRGLGCLQLGRVVQGRLGVLGQDRVAGDDGRFHPLATRTSAVDSCAQLDAGRRLFVTTTIGAIPAAGTTHGACMPPGTTTGVPASMLCPEADMRSVYFGTLGPQARSVTYLGDDGREHTVAAAGPYGAYLIVLHRDPSHRFSGMAGGGTPNPANTTITSVRFAGGRTCRVTDIGFAGGPEACPLPGYRPRPAPHLTTADVASPVRARVERRGGRRLLVVRFRARVAVTDASSSYEVTRHRAGAATWGSGMTQRDIARGSVVAYSFVGAPHGATYHGTVTYRPKAGLVGLPPPGPAPVVGRWTLRVP